MYTVVLNLVNSTNPVHPLTPCVQLFFTWLAAVMDDYERLAAREWQEIGDTHTLVRPRLPSKAVGIGYFEPDTQARIAWRNREPPTDFVTLPRDFIRDERNVQGRAKERPDGQDIRVPELERIAHETSTEVVQQLEKGRRGGTNVVRRPTSLLTSALTHKKLGRNHLGLTRGSS